MRHLDLSFDGRRLSDRNQPDNGIRPHGGYRGSKRHPMCHFSHDKGREFHQKMEDEIERLILSNELALHGTSPSWSLAVHKEPSFTDESPLITNQFLAASKAAPSNGVTLNNRSSLLPPKKGFKPQKKENVQFYRPNSTHQYLSATELKNASEGDVNLLYGRPTRTTLLRARQRCTSAPLNNNQVKRRESDPKIDDYRSCYSVPSNTENLQLDKDGETLHSFLTGARYNRAHCLDARSVDHTGVYMPRNNTAMGCFFTGPKGHEYLKEFEENTPRSESVPSPRIPPPGSPKRRRPTTAPGHGNRSAIRPAMVTAPVSPPSPPRSQRRQAWTLSGPASARYKTLNVIGCRLPIGMGKEMALRLPNLQPIPSPRKPLDETYRGYQPPPTPISLQQTSQGIPTDRKMDPESAGFPLESGNELTTRTAAVEDEMPVVTGTPVTQVVVKNGSGDDDEKDKMLEDKIKEPDVVVDDDDAVVEKKDNEKEEMKTEVELEEEKEVEEEEIAKENKVVEEAEREDEILVDDKKVEEEEENDDINIVVDEVRDDQIIDDDVEEEIVEKAEEGEGENKEEGVEEGEKELKEERDGEDAGEKPQKEVRFFITEKDREEGDVGVDDEVENNNEIEEEVGEEVVAEADDFKDVNKEFEQGGGEEEESGVNGGMAEQNEGAS